jgi:replicative DNA helicase
MNSVTQETLEYISKYPLSEIIGLYLPVLKKRKYKHANCPFHDDGDYALNINDKKGFWYCFIDEVGGDAISFVMKFSDKNFIEAIKDIEQKLKRRNTQKLLELKIPMKSFFNELDENPTRFCSGFNELDKLVCFEPGQLVLLAARPAMGKTAFALNLASNLCKENDSTIAIFSLEMIATEVSSRLLGMKAKINSKRIRTKKFEDQDLRKIGQALKELSDYRIYVNDSADTTIEDMYEQCLEIKKEKKLDFVIIDYIQLLNSSCKTGNRQDQLRRMMFELKLLAKELNCVALVLSQLNRNIDKRQNKRPTLEDIQKSHLCPEIIDVIITLYRDGYYFPDSTEAEIAEILIRKNSKGDRGVAKLKWNDRCVGFESLF